MSITFVVLCHNGQRFDPAQLSPDDSELSLSDGNGRDVLAALGIDETCSSRPWPIARCRSLLTTARRNRLGQRSPAVSSTEHSEPGRMTLIECGRREGYVERLAFLEAADRAPARLPRCAASARVPPAKCVRDETAPPKAARAKTKRSRPISKPTTLPPNARKVCNAPAHPP
jgi:hypothetical protein